MAEFKNPKVQAAFVRYENGDITKRQYLEELREINLNSKYKYISQFYHGEKQAKGSSWRKSNSDLFEE